MSNISIITGNIGKGELRYTSGAEPKPVYSFSVADQTGFGDRDKTQWIECSLWGKQALNTKLTDMLVKGAKVTITGQIEIEEARDNYPAKLRVPFVKEINQVAPPKNYQQGAPQQSQSTPPVDDDFDDSAPF